MTEEALFLAALDRPAADRPRFLDEACANDPALRHQSLIALDAGRHMASTYYLELHRLSS